MKFSTVCTCGAVFAGLAAAQDSGDVLVSSQALQDDIDLEGLLRGSQTLQNFAYAYPERNRVFGGKAHNDTVRWIYRTLRRTGAYDVQLQKFVELYSDGNATLQIAGTDTPVGLFTYTSSGSATAPLVAVSNLGCDASDYPANVTGNIALISRGNCTFGIKATNAKAAGAAAALIYNNVEDELPLAGTLGGPGDFVPVAGLTQARGQELVTQLGSGPVEANLQVNSVLENRTTFNVIAETKGGDHNNVLALGAHTDSVVAGPGINDDGSGTVAILRVAQALANYNVTNAVRFCFWSAEEYGLLGSTYYIGQLNQTQSELEKIRAYLNFDMIASPNYVYAIYDGDGNAFNISGPTGSAQIEANFENFYRANNESFVPTAFDGRSDYGPFLDVGIPAGGLFTGAEALKTEAEVALFGGEAGVAYDQCYHQACDNTTNINNDAYLLNSKAIADAVATYALSFDSLGPPAKFVRRDEETRKMRKARRESRINHNIGHGHGMCGHKNPKKQ